VGRLDADRESPLLGFMTLATIERRTKTLTSGLAAILCVFFPFKTSLAQASDRQLTEQGKSLLADRCSHCHQIGPGGISPLSEAPPFHALMQRYKPEQLEEALGEGLGGGHPATPEIAFQPDEIAAIVAYLGTLQKKR
jgi:mono/diheme cytochrome c family protein